MKMKSLLIFFLLSISLSLDHGQAREVVLREPEALQPVQPPPSRFAVCSAALKTCFPHKGFLDGWFPRHPSLPPVSPECCSAVEKIDNVERQCFPYGYLLHWILNYSCRRSPIPSPPQTPAPPASPSCPFLDACDVKFKGFLPTYNISNPDCCKFVKETPILQGQCFRYFYVFYRIKFQCNCEPSPPPHEGPPTSPSKPPPSLKPSPPKSPSTPPPQAPAKPPPTKT